MFGNGAGTGMKVAFRLLPTRPARLLASTALLAAVLGATMRMAAPCLTGAATSRTTVASALASVLCVPVLIKKKTGAFKEPPKGGDKKHQQIPRVARTIKFRFLG